MRIATSRAGWAAVAIARKRLARYPDHPVEAVEFVAPSAVAGGWSVMLAGCRRILVSNEEVDEALAGHPQRLTVKAREALMLADEADPLDEVRRTLGFIHPRRP